MLTEMITLNLFTSENISYGDLVSVFQH